jgi:hypothetical protein
LEEVRYNLLGDQLAPRANEENTSTIVASHVLDVSPNRPIDFDETINAPHQFINQFILEPHEPQAFEEINEEVHIEEDHQAKHVKENVEIPIEQDNQLSYLYNHNGKDICYFRNLACFNLFEKYRKYDFFFNKPMNFKDERNLILV